MAVGSIPHPPITTLHAVGLAAIGKASSTTCANQACLKELIVLVCSNSQQIDRKDSILWVRETIVRETNLMFRKVLDCVKWIRYDDYEQPFVQNNRL